MITFVGRLNDFQKGYDVFLKALARLETIGERRHCAWLIGGSAEEVERVRGELQEHRALVAMEREARLLLWGRVESDGLPELYSRSTVVVMPSRRETFGLVAIEAMLCAAPVAASAVGGLKHTVVHGRTGAHFPSGDAQALAFVLHSLIRNPSLSDWLGENASDWARRVFARSASLGGLNRILQAQAGAVLPPHPVEDPERFFAGEAAAAITAGLGEELVLEQVTRRHHATFRASRAGGETWFVKRFTDRPDFDFSVYCVDPHLRPTDRNVRLHRTLVAAQSPATLPPMERHGPIVRWPWALRSTVSDEAALVAARRLAATLPGADAAVVSACQAACCELVACRSWSALAAFDRAAALLNAPLTGAADVFVRCDPRAELVRLRLHLDGERWPLDAALRAQMSAVLNRASALVEGTETTASIHHGDLRPEHVVDWQGGQVVCDLEEIRYAFGDLDATSLVWNAVRGDPSSAFAQWRALSLASGARMADGRRLALLWYVAAAFHWGLGKASWGAPSALMDACAMCMPVLEAGDEQLR